ncbi:MAG: hypothetical protein N0A15_15870, partial [Anaerolineae bacterium]|nr:hypothetical protein [Anaerolineae bacterium]
MSVLTKRERVLRTIRFQETDRTPLYDILQNDAIIEHYSGQKLTVENGHWVKGIAIGRVLDMTRMPEGPQAPREERWENGIVVRVERWTQWIIERPFYDIPSLAEWVKGEIRRNNAQIFGPTYAERVHHHIRECQAVFAQGDPTGRQDPAVLILESGVGLTEMYWMTGIQMFSYLMADYPDLVEEWLEA